MKAETTRRPLLGGVGQNIAHEVDTAALQTGRQHFRHRRLDAFMGVGDHQLDAAQPSAAQLAQEIRPEGLGFRGADVHAQHFAAAIGVGADRDDHRRRDDAAIVANFDVGGVDPKIGPVAFDWAVEEGFDLAVDLLAQAADRKRSPDTILAVRGACLVMVGHG